VQIHNKIYKTYQNASKLVWLGSAYSAPQARPLATFMGKGENVNEKVRIGKGNKEREK